MLFQPLPHMHHAFSEQRRHRPTGLQSSRKVKEHDDEGHAELRRTRRTSTEIRISNTIDSRTMIPLQTPGPMHDASRRLRKLCRQKSARVTRSSDAVPDLRGPMGGHQDITAGTSSTQVLASDRLKIRPIAPWAFRAASSCFRRVPRPYRRTPEPPLCSWRRGVPAFPFRPSSEQNNDA